MGRKKYKKRKMKLKKKGKKEEKILTDHDHTPPSASLAGHQPLPR